MIISANVSHYRHCAVQQTLLPNKTPMDAIYVLITGLQQVFPYLLLWVLGNSKNLMTRFVGHFFLIFWQGSSKIILFVLILQYYVRSTVATKYSTVYLRGKGLAIASCMYINVSMILCTYSK